MKKEAGDILEQVAGVRTLRRDDDTLAAGVKVIGRNGEEGMLNGNNHECGMEGCRGTRLSVKWPDGKTTYPCTRGMDYDSETKAWRAL